MSEAWHHALFGLRESFAARRENLRHLLLTIDCVVYIVPGLTGYDIDRGSILGACIDPGDDHAKWGLPPGEYWRQVGGTTEPLPIVAQWTKHGSPLTRKHTFYGEASGLEALCNLSYQAVRRLIDVPSEVYGRLSRALGMPCDLPPVHAHDPTDWWMRAVHGLAKARHPNSPLWATVAPARQFWQCNMDFVALHKAKEQGRQDVGIFEYSILHADIFRCSEWAIDLILGEIGDRPPTATAEASRVSLTAVNATSEPMPEGPGTSPEPTSEGAEPTPELLLESELRRDKKPTQAALVAYMRGKQSALPADVGHVVHGNGDASDKTIRGNLDRLNQSAEAFGIALRYRLRGGRVWKEGS